MPKCNCASSCRRKSWLTLLLRCLEKYKRAINSRFAHANHICTQQCCLHGELFPRRSNNDFYSHVPRRHLFKQPRALELCLFPLIRPINLGIHESVHRRDRANTKGEAETSHLCLASVWSPRSCVCSPQQEFLPFS